VFVFALPLLPAIYLDQSNYLANQHQVFGSVVPFTSYVPGPIKLFSQSTAGVLALLCLLLATYPEQSNYLSNQQQVFGFAVPFTSLHKMLQ
jgi:hypothetical protein